MNVLTIQNLSKHFGGIQALSGLNLAIAQGERHAIIGPNGAGKSTLFNLISGELTASTGKIWLHGRDITPLPIHSRTHCGLGRTSQRNNLFLGLTALENACLAVQHQQNVHRNWFRRMESFTAVTSTAEAILDKVGLLPQKTVKASELAYGQQRALEMALALALQPSLLLLDEPTAGMSPAETANIVRLIQELPTELTVLIVEHDMDVIFTLADRITVLHYGQIISRGLPDEVRQDPQVQAIYLGGN